MRKYTLSACITALLASCGTGLDISQLESPIEDAAELLTVTPTDKMTHQGNGLISDGRNLNPVLSKSLRQFDAVTVEFPDDTVETLEGISDYNVFAWRQVAKNIGNGELQCDVAPAPVVDPGVVLKVAEVALRLGAVAATFAPVKDKTLITTYDSQRNNRLVSMEFRSGEATAC